MLSSVSRYSVNFDQGSLLEPAISLEEVGRSAKHHWLTSDITPDGKNQFLEKAAARVKGPAILTLAPTGKFDRITGNQHELTTMLLRPCAEVSKTTVIPVAQIAKRTYMLLDHKKGDGAGTFQYIQSPSTYSRKADGEIEHQTHSFQVLSLLRDRGIVPGVVECSSDFLKVEQDKMKAEVTFQGVKCTALLQRAVDFRVAGDRSCNRNVVYTAIITPEKGSVLSKASLERDYRLLDVTSEVDGSSTAEKAKTVAESCITKFGSNFQYTKDDTLVVGSALHKIYSVIGRSRFTTPTAYACYATIIGVISWILLARRAV
jgi:hypothetical protein